MFDVKQIDVKSTRLQEVAAQLKTELFGMDNIIDKIVQSIRAWYTFPELIQRPVIVNLWGLTGVGKTQLVRRLAQLLEMQDRFVEVQMDGITSSNSNTETTIANVLSMSAIEEGQPGILLLDEFQRFRAIDVDGGDVKAERFQDVWMLLSDGKFAADASLFREIEMMIAQQSWSADMMSIEEPEEVRTTRRRPKKVEEPKPEKKRKYSIYPWEASRLKKQLKLSEPVQEIMTWDTQTLLEKVEYVKQHKAGLQQDFSKLLVFVSGNLDEAYAVANSVNDCDTDADIFYKMTQRIGVTEIKRALAQRFKPEQISRLGNNHIVYPSIKKETYQKLIEHTCGKYTSGMTKLTGIEFAIDQSTLDEIYENSVYPAQGTRPVFSSVHKIFSDAMVQIAFKAIQDSIKDITLYIDPKKSVLRGVSKSEWECEAHIDLDIRSKRQAASADFNTLVAVHEAGHALVHALLSRNAPAEVKINTASFTGGFMIPNPNPSMVSNQQMLDQIAVLYAGTIAEEVVFGASRRTSGCSSDISKASQTAAYYVRHLAMDGHMAVVGNEETDMSGIVSRTTYLAETNSNIELICTQQAERARQLLKDHKHIFQRLVDRLLSGEVLTSVEFKTLIPEIKYRETQEEPYSKLWKDFTEE